METVITPMIASLEKWQTKLSALKWISSFPPLLALTILLSSIPSLTGQGTVPERLSFQGYMEDGNGIPLGEGAPENREVIFRIFPAATGGTAVWSEKQTVTFDMGNYSVLLGQGVPLSDNDPRPQLSTVVINAEGNQLYVETSVEVNGNSTPVLPRLRLLPTPYAFLARKALRADTAGNADTADSAKQVTGQVPTSQLTGTLSGNLLENGTVTTEKIANGNITTAKIAANSVTPAKIGTNVLLPTQIPNLDASKITEGKLADEVLPANLAKRNTANTFTANQTINGSLTVRDNLSLGTTDLKVATGTESLRIVRGQVKITGSPTTPQIVSGSGYSVKRNTSIKPPGYQVESVVEIVFTPPFTDKPVITVTVVSNDAEGNNTAIPGIYLPRVESVSNNGAILSFYHGANGGWLLQAPFMFTAVGAR